MSTNPNVKEILERVESDVDTLRWGHQRAKLFVEARNQFRENGNTDKAKEMDWENQLFCLRYLGPNQRKRSKKRFAPLVEYQNGAVFPDITTFSEEQIDYYKRRVDETSNPIHKARYSDIVWELKKEHLFARKAIDSYLQTSTQFYKNDWQLELVDCLGRATELALTLNDKNEIEKVKEALFHWIRTLAKNEKYRFCLELIDALIEMRKFADKEELKIAVEIAISGSRFYEQTKDGYHLQRFFLERLVQLMGILEDSNKALEYRKLIAESFVKEGDWKLTNYPSGNLVATHFYEEAAKRFADLGFTEKVDELKKRIKKHTRQAIETEMKEIKIPITIPRKPTINYINSLKSLTLKKALQKLANEAFLVPNLKRIRLEVKEQKKVSPLGFMVQSVSIRDDNPVLKSQTEAERFGDYVVERVVMHYKIAGDIFEEVIEELVKTKNLDHISFLTFLSSSDVYEKNSLDMIGSGLERYFSNDYPSALHILIPQLERTLRHMLESLGLPTTVLHGKIIEEKTLGRILKEPKLKEFLGEDFLFYLCSLLTDKRGDNLRNDIAHGLITKERCTKNMATNILLIFLLLTKFNVKSE